MKRKLIIAFLTLVAVFACVFSLSACDGDNKGNSEQGGNTEHKHSYTESVIAPTCTKQGYTLYVCVCGESFKDNYTDALGHDYVKYICSRCGEIDPDIPITEGLQYSEIKENEEVIAYSVSGIGEAKDTDIVIPSTYNGKPVTAISDSAFYACKGLTSVIIPNSVTSIGNWAFIVCINLTNVILPNNMTSIGEYAFGYCYGLTSITIPNGVTSISGSAFIGCSGLTSTTIPDGVTSIGEWAFYNCSNFTSITIPDSVTSIGERAFYNCSNFTSITFNGTIAQWNAIEKGNDWNYNTGEYTIHCTDGDISK